MPPRTTDLLHQQENGYISSQVPKTPTAPRGTPSNDFGVVPSAPMVKGGNSTSASLPRNDAQLHDKGSQKGHQGSSAASASWDSRLAPIDDGKTGSIAIPETKESETSPVKGDRKPVRGIGVAQAVLGAAQELARMS